MILIATIVGLSAALITGLVVFWKNIIAWINKAVEKIKEVLGFPPHGTRTYIERTEDGFRNKSKYYYQNRVTREWEEIVYTKIVDEDEIPPEVMRKAKSLGVGEEASTTEELKLAINA
ncbi:MAG: hypothetical protein HUJ86_02810 [Synergistes sp.]|nr:hypothetical protein [Synergistes sp.]